MDQPLAFLSLTVCDADCNCVVATYMLPACRNEDQEAAQQYLLASAAKYGESLRWNPNNPQVGTMLVYH